MKKTYKIIIGSTLLFFLSTTSNGTAISFADSSKQDKQHTHFDSVLLHFSNQNRLGKFIYKNLFKSNQAEQAPIDNMQSRQKQDRINKFEGKVIRNVYFKTLDPFGTEVDDTLILRKGTIEDIGNKINVSSRSSNIQSLILFKKGDRIEPLRIKESERLLRRQEYIRDARIIVPANTKRNTDSIDLIVIVQDRWSINASVGASTTSSEFRVTETNLLGTGSRITQAGEYDIPKGKFSNWQGELSDNNLKNTYIDGRLFYNISPNLRFHGINFNRTFFSPLTKWAGSAGISRYNENKEYVVSDGIIIPAKVVYNLSDVWLGRSIKINQNAENGRTNSLVIGSRLVKTDYILRPNLSLDTLDSYRDVNLYLFSLGFSSRRYYKDKKIYRFGNTEDIPEGRSFNAIFGILDEEKTQYTYHALKYSAGQHIANFGYLSGSIQYGIFYNNYMPSRGVFNVDLSYFSDLWTRGRWNMRQFAYLQVTNGLNRTANESISLNGRGTEGLYGFNSFAVLGKNKTLLKLESIIYTPFNVAGVQVASVVFAGFGKIGRPINSNINPNTIYQAYGLGFLLRKENLVVNTIQITVGFYPNIPDGTGANFKYNPIGINNLNLRDFDVAKPDLLNYR
jgi:hypothetical protein